MKKTTCKALAGACEEVITGATPEEMAENSKKHAMSMMTDPAHQEAMNKMMAMSKEDQQKFYADFVASFESLEDAE